MPRPRATAEDVEYHTTLKMLSGQEAAAKFAAYIRIRPLSLEEAGRLMSGLLPSDWRQLRPSKQAHCRRRAEQVIERISGEMGIPIYEDITDEGRVYGWAGFP